MLNAGCKYQKITPCVFQGHIYHGTDPWGDKEVKGTPQTLSPPAFPGIVPSSSFDIDKNHCDFSLATTLKAVFGCLIQ